MEKILVTALLLAAGFVVYKALSTNKQPSNKANGNQKSGNSPTTNLNRLSEKFKQEYINQKLSEFANRENIDDSKILSIYPAYVKNLSMASIKWSSYNGNNAELQARLANYNGGGSTLQYKFEQMLKNECKEQIDELISKIESLK